MMRYAVPTRLMVFARSADWRRGFAAARHSAVVLLIAVALAAAGRPVLSGDASAAAAKVAIRGAGATFPAPLYEKWIDVYRRNNPDVSIAYDVVGSGEGQRRFIAGGVDFGASDAALSDEQMSRVQAGARLIPVTAGMVVVAYNIAGLGGSLKLSRDILTDSHRLAQLASSLRALPGTGKGGGRETVRGLGPHCRPGVQPGPRIHRIAG